MRRGNPYEIKADEATVIKIVEEIVDAGEEYNVEHRLCAYWSCDGTGGCHTCACHNVDNLIAWAKGE